MDSEFIPFLSTVWGPSCFLVHLASCIPPAPQQSLWGLAASAGSQGSLTPCVSEGKASACNVGDTDSIPGSGRFPGEGKGSPLQYSCLENPIDRGAWQATVHGSQRFAHDWPTSLSFFRLFVRSFVLSHLEARNHWCLWHFFFIKMAGDIFISLYSINISFLSLLF